VLPMAAINNGGGWPRYSGGGSFSSAEKGESPKGSLFKNTIEFMGGGCAHSFSRESGGGGGGGKKGTPGVLMKGG